MTTKCTRAQAFLALGTIPHNPQRSWSARSIDKKTVAISLWKDQLRGPAGRMTCSKIDWGDWHQGYESRIFFEDLQWAVDHCGGIVRVVVAVRDPKVLPQVRMAECYPCRNLYLRVIHCDLVTGSFTLEQVAIAEAA